MPSEAYVPNKYVSIENQGGNVATPPPPPPPAYYHNVTHYHPRPRSKRGCCGCSKCIKCCCCCVCFLVVVFFLFAATVGALYLFFRPHIPSYSLENFDITSFELKNDSKLHTEIALVIKADNPNKDIGLEYEQDNHIDLIFEGTDICWGQFPYFYQPGNNATTFNVTLKGQSDFGQRFQDELMRQQKIAHIRLFIMVKIPVRVVIDGIRLRQFLVNVYFTLVIDHLEPSTTPKILEKNMNYAIEF